LTSTPANAARRHQVRDGDTLGDLAQQYYGDARRYREIFDANRNVLSNPEVLPIGATLEIPGYDPASVRPAGPPPAARLVPQVFLRNP
jgi:nucleoid-associated protein YgaU